MAPSPACPARPPDPPSGCAPDAPDLRPEGGADDAAPLSEATPQDGDLRPQGIGISLATSEGEDTAVCAHVSAVASNRSNRRSQTLRELLDFGSEDGLRAARLATVLRGCGALFAHSEGSASTFELSRPATRIDVFISHNWSVGRARKFVVVALFSSLGLALGVAYLVQALCVVAIALGMVTKTVGQFLTFPVCMVVLFFGRQWASLLGFGGPTVFLDKVCIHQTDKALQRQGIAKLGAFLSHSSSILVCYSDVYLRRLWTIYEVACFLAVHGRSRMHVIHMRGPLVVLSLAGCIWAINVVIAICQEILGESDSFRWFFDVAATFGAAVAGITTLRKLAREADGMRGHVASFDVKSAGCLKEEDRAYVERNIASFMRYLPEADPQASQDEHLLSFNELVKKELPLAMEHPAGLTGVTGVPPRLLLLCLLPWLAFKLDGCAFMWWRKRRLRSALLAAYTVAMYLGAFPLMTAAIMRFTRFQLSLHGWGEVCYVAVAVCASTGVVALLTYVTAEELVPRAEAGGWYLVVFVVLCSSLLILSGLVLCWSPKAAGSFPQIPAETFAA